MSSSLSSGLTQIPFPLEPLNPNTLEILSLKPYPKPDYRVQLRNGFPWFWSAPIGAAGCATSALLHVEFTRFQSCLPVFFLSFFLSSLPLEMPLRDGNALPVSLAFFGGIFGHAVGFLFVGGGVGV